MLNIAIIGVSGYGKHVLESFLPLVAEGRLRFVGATIINSEEVPETCLMLKEMGCGIFTDYKEMLRSLCGQMDLCVIPTGIDWHLPMACEAMRHGANVFVEKPLAGSVADAAKILAASREWNRSVVVGFQDLSSEPVLEVKRRLVRGEIGRVRRIRAIGIWPRGFSYYGRNAWSGCLYRDGRAVFDSPLNNAFAHLLNLALFFADPDFASVARPALVSGSLFRTYPIASFDTASIHVVTDQDVSIHGYVSHACIREMPPRLVIEGTHGRVDWNYEREVFICNSEEQTKRSFGLENAVELRMTLARAIAGSLENGSRLVNDGKNALSHAMAIEKLHASAVIQDIPDEHVSRDGEMLGIRGGETWLAESFEEGSPLFASRLDRIARESDALVSLQDV